MPATAGPQTIGYGSQLQLGGVTGGTDTFVTLLGVTDVTFGSNKTDTIDVTDMGTANAIRKFIAGLQNAGDCSAKINVIPGDATQASLWAAENGSAYDWKVIYPNTGRTIAFSGIIESIDEAIPLDKQPTYSLKIKITGPKTFS